MQERCADLDASAILNGRQLSVFACNRGLDESMDLVVRLADAQIGKLASAEIVTGNDPKASNTFENPINIVSKPFKEVAISDGVTTLKLPPLSIVAATFDLV